MSELSSPLRIQDVERVRAKRLAEAMGVSENRLYSELIHDALGVLARAADALPIATDRT